jgi:hypothetical protein
MGIIVADEIHSKEMPDTLLPAAYICFSKHSTKITKNAANGYDVLARFNVYSSLPAKQADGAVLEVIEVRLTVAEYPADSGVLVYDALKARYSPSNVYDVI